MDTLVEPEIKRHKCVECKFCDDQHNYYCLIALEQYRYYMSVYKHLNCEHFEPRDNSGNKK